MKKLTIFTLKKNNIKDFAKERNLLVDKAKTEWVMFLDSDEKMSKTPKLKDSKQEAYKIKRKTYFLKELIGIDYPIRLVKKGTGKWVRQVHEYWKPDNLSLTGIIDTPIIHNTAENLTDYLNKINLYSTLHANANLKEGKSANIIKIIIFPIAKFIQTLIKSRNIVFSIMQSLHSYLSWTKLYFLQH